MKVLRMRRVNIQNSNTTNTVQTLKDKNAKYIVNYLQ